LVLEERSDAMPRKNAHYIGWMVMSSDPALPKDQRVCRAKSQEEAREKARAFNKKAAEKGSRVLYWAEWWSENTAENMEGVDLP
jgi:hypothetical protein